METFQYNDESNHHAEIRRERKLLHNMLNDIATTQKKDMKLLWSGHLNHDVLNKQLQNVPTEKKIVEMSKIPRRLREYYGLEHLDKPISPLICEAGDNSLDHFNLRDMGFDIDMTSAEGFEGAKVDNVNTNAEAAPKLNNLQQGKNEEQSIPNDCKEGVGKLDSSDEDRQKSRTIKIDLAQRRFLQVTQLFTEELGQLVVDDPFYEAKKLQVYNSCFEQIIEGFKGFGTLLADVKVQWDQLKRPRARDLM
jgi:hypothetical protein